MPAQPFEPAVSCCMALVASRFRLLTAAVYPALHVHLPICSRPTAVNLSDSAVKLKNVAATAAAQPGANAESVTAAVIEAAEATLQQDIEANKVRLHKYCKFTTRLAQFCICHYFGKKCSHRLPSNAPALAICLALVSVAVHNAIPKLCNCSHMSCCVFV